jgi:hypothetical protein
VVTSRVANYRRLSVLLNLRGALIVQPLSPRQVQVYLGTRPERLAEPSGG